MKTPARIRYASKTTGKCCECAKRTSRWSNTYAPRVRPGDTQPDDACAAGLRAEYRDAPGQWVHAKCERSR